MPPILAPTTPDNTGPRVRPGAFRSFTVPSKAADNGGSPASAPGSGASPGARDIENLYACLNAKIVAFDTPKTSLKSTPTRGSPASQDASGTLSWMYPSERTMAAGPLQIYRVISSGICFIKSGRLLHPTMPLSQCWCVDGESKFVLRVRDDLHYRMELPFDTEDDKRDVEEFKGVLAKILRYERTHCPFKRGFHVELPEMDDSPSRIRVVQSQHPRTKKRWLDGVWLPEDEAARQSSAPALAGLERRASLFRTPTMEAANSSTKSRDSEDESVSEQDTSSVDGSLDAEQEVVPEQPQVELGTVQDALDQPASSSLVSSADAVPASVHPSRPAELVSLRSVTEPLLHRDVAPVAVEKAVTNDRAVTQPGDEETSTEDIARAEDEVLNEADVQAEADVPKESEIEADDEAPEEHQNDAKLVGQIEDDVDAEKEATRECDVSKQEVVQLEEHDEAEDDALSLSSRTSFHTASDEETPDRTVLEANDAEHERATSPMMRRPQHTRDISEITITGLSDRPTTAGETSNSSLSPPPTPTLVVDDDIDDQEWHDAVTPPDTLRLRRLPKSQLRSKSPSTVASSSVSASQAVFAPRAPDTLSTSIRGKGKQLTAALIRKAYLLITGPSADLVALMLRIAAKIVNGTNAFHSYDLGSNMDGMAFSGTDPSARPVNFDDADDWDEDDFGIPLDNSMSNASRSSSLNLGNERIISRGRQRTPNEIWGISQEEESPGLAERMKDVD